MHYNEALSDIYQYGKLYASGMKKDANALLVAFCEKIGSLPQSEFDDVVNHLVFYICETDSLDFLMNRGNGEIPFQLKKLIIKWLLPRCEEQRMPEMRWFYQLFKRDSNYYKKACSFLKNAYESKYVDNKTFELVFLQNIKCFEYGLHELPIGLLISDDECEVIVKQCDSIIEKNIVSQGEIEHYYCLKKEYLDFIYNT